MTRKFRIDKVQILGWTARILAGTSAGLILLIFIGESLIEGFEPLLKLTAREALMMAAFFTMWLGLILGWRWEIVGGALTVGGLTAFYLLDYLFSGTLPEGPFYLLFAFPGFLFLLAALLSRVRVKGQP